MAKKQNKMRMGRMINMLLYILVHSGQSRVFRKYIRGKLSGVLPNVCCTLAAASIDRGKLIINLVNRE